ncbi:MAG: nucleoside phosphorylase [Desulfobacteraceae bacterium]
MILSKIETEEGLIRPVKRKSDPRVGPDVLFSLIAEDLDYLLKLIQPEKIDPHDLGLFKIYQVKDSPMTLSGPFLGAPQAVMGMEKMIALGAKRIWVLGWCGSLQPSLRIGDLFVPTGAVSEEGTSQHYPIADKALTTDKELNKILETALREAGYPFVRGMAWTTDAPYRETPSKVKAHQERGILAVEMEMSAMMTVAIYRSVKLAGLLVVSDELFELKWHTGFSDPKFKKRSKESAELLLHLVQSLNR